MEVLQMRDIILNLDTHSCMLLIASVNAYQEILQERYKTSEYFFHVLQG